MLTIYNTLSRSKEVFRPIEPGKVRIYVCGMTVYDYCHLGHARVMVVFDMVVRWLRASGFDVRYVRNITDIDDKIINRARENGESIHALTGRYIAAMYEDADALGVLRPDHEPRATEYIAPMLKLIGTLEQKGLAYIAANQDVYYAVRRFPGYGRLSGKSVDELRSGERVDVFDDKADPLDFVLWKQAKADEPDEAGWDSPWGRGRPGWHIECSAMSSELLGEGFDIHGGGQDLQFPHHENEIAQSEGASGHAFVNYWMHNGFIRVDNEKMSKSLGNFSTIRDVLARYDPEVVRFFILRAHYRSPLNYADVHLDDARQALSRLYTAVKGVAVADTPAADWASTWGERFRAALDDDFNTVEALAVLFELANEANREDSAALSGQVRALAAVLGLLGREAQDFFQAGAGGVADRLDAATIDAKIAARGAAKKARDFAEADRLRAELAAAGVVLEDSPQGTSWRWG
ncbi:cysteine--tRNA ligase [Betaproteobacteria bacterium]|nr:cysteine--tRNA ligase [Betaproteobacteria bacterium]